MSSTVELSKPYDCEVTIRSRPSTIPFIKERHDNHLLNYVLDHQRPQLSKSIDLNLVFNIASHTLLFERLEFSLASLGKAAQGKDAKGKATKGKVAKGKDAKRNAAKEQTFMGQEDKKVVNNSFLRLVEDLAAWDDFSWGEYYWEEFYKKAVNLIDNHRDTHTNFQKKNPSKLPTYSIYRFAWAFKVDGQNGFTHDDEPEAEQDGSGASDGASARAKFEETISTREATSVCDDIDEADAAADDNAKATSVNEDVGVPDAATDDNAKAMSICDDIDETDATPDDNPKATGVPNDIGVPDAAADDNPKATSVCDDIDEADAAADDNAKATSVCDDINEVDAAADDNEKAMNVYDNVGVPNAAADDNAKVPISNVYSTLVDNENVLIKDAHEIINHTDPPIHGFQIMLWGGLEKKRDNLDEAKAIQKRMSKRQRELPTPTKRRLKRHIHEVVSVADNGEVVKETQLPDSHENEEGDSVIRLPACYWKLFKGNPHWALGRESYKRFQHAKDKNTRPQRSFGLFKSSKEATSLVSLGEWLERSLITTFVKKQGRKDNEQWWGTVYWREIVSGLASAAIFVKMEVLQNGISAMVIENKISPPNDTKTPVKSPILIFPSSTGGSSSPVRSTTPPDYLFDESTFTKLDNSLWIIPRPMGSESVPEEPNELDAY
uniref:Phospholipase-like protein n=1 Tax=Tanacetum cinerariifolium TaxID=118510 RepID=A0A6L2NIB3_TANCI|nr:hypothetical protein [Tanacetum cinerariifolium]